MKHLALAIALLTMTGCCHFAPCHPATYVAGTVSDATSGSPIPNADVRLYNYKTRTLSTGCFSLGGADALPFELAVSAPGYKPLLERPQKGFYRLDVILAPEADPRNSVTNSDKVARADYAAAVTKCSE
jgi:hypothetical protein